MTARSEPLAPAMRGGFDPLRFTWQLLCNVKFALFLVGLAGIAGMIGVVVPQMPIPMRGNPAARQAWLELQHNDFGAFATLAAQSAYEPMRRILTDTIRLIFFLALPITVWLTVLARPITAFLLERGAFDAAATRLVAWGLFCYALGLVGLAVVEVMARVFYALGDTVTPVLAGGIQILTMVVSSLALSSILFPAPRIATKSASFDLHVLGTPPAFILSQDQTLRKKIFTLASVSLRVFTGFDRFVASYHYSVVKVRRSGLTISLRPVYFPTDEKPMSSFNIGSSDCKTNRLVSLT